MCKLCVADGAMTQEELDAANEAKSVLGDGGLLAAITSDPQAFLESLRSAVEEDRDDAMADLDKTVASALKLHRDKLAELTAGGLVLDTATKLRTLAEVEAGELMFNQTPRAIAYALAVVIERYNRLLEQWAELYAKAAIGDDDSIDLDAAKTAEARDAVTRATDPDHKTGMYL